MAEAIVALKVRIANKEILQLDFYKILFNTTAHSYRNGNQKLLDFAYNNIQQNNLEKLV